MVTIQKLKEGIPISPLNAVNLNYAAYVLHFIRI